MNPGNGQMGYRPSGRGAPVNGNELVNGNRHQENGYMRPQVAGFNLPPGLQIQQQQHHQVYPQLDPFVPPRPHSAIRHSMNGHANNVHPSMVHFHLNGSPPNFNGQRSPNMVPAANFPSPARYSLAPVSGSAVVASSPSNFAPRMPVLANSIQQHAFAAPSAMPTPMVNMSVPPYSIYGHAAPINEVPRFNVAATTTTNATSTPLTSSFHASAGIDNNGNQRANTAAAAQQNYSDCSSISDSEDEDRPQDLRVRKVQPPVQMSGATFGSTGQRAGAGPQPQMVNQHKKFQYKAWTAPDPAAQGCSAAARAGDVANRPQQGPTPATASTSSTWSLEEMVNQLRLSPFITRNEAASRLLALGNRDEVQREIDAFAAIIRCGSVAGMLYNRSTQPPPFSGGVGENINQAQARPRQPEEPNNDEEDMTHAQQRQSVIKGQPKKK